MPNSFAKASTQPASHPHNRGHSHTSATCETPAQVVRGILHHEYGRFRNGIKLLANSAGVSPRTAEAWLNGRAAPNLQNLVPLMANCDALSAAILKLVEERKNARDDHR